MTTKPISTEESIYASFKIQDAGKYKCEALESFIRYLANEKGADVYEAAEKFLTRTNNFDQLAMYYNDLGGEIDELIY